MAVNVANRNFYKDGRNCKRNQESLTDEIALRDEILQLKRQVMVLRRANEQNLVKFRKYEDEAKRKDREIEQLMDPRKNAEITKVLSTKGAAILMTLKDQNNALIQMVLNKDVQIRRLLAEMKMSKLYASSRTNSSYREEIARLKNLLVKSQEKLKENLERENQIKSMCAIENSFLEISSSGQSSPRDLDELQMVIRSLEMHIKYSNDLLHKKDQEISILNDELNFLKKLLQYKTTKNKPFHCHSTDLHKHSTDDVSQTRVPDINPQQTKISSAELLQLFGKPPDGENAQSNSAPASSTRLPPNGTLSKHKSLSNIACGENWKECTKDESTTESTLLHDVAVGEDAKVRQSLVKGKERKKILTRHREGKKRISRKFGGSGKRKKFHENDKKTRNASLLETSEPKKEEINETSDIFQMFDSKGAKTQEISWTENDEGDSGGLEGEGDEEGKEPQREGVNEMQKSETPNEEAIGGVKMDSGGGNSPPGVATPEKNCVHFRREIYQQSFDSSFESENEYAVKQQVQQVQVVVEIDSIMRNDESDNSESSISGDVYGGELPEKGDGCPPDEDNDDDDDVITR